MEYERIHKPQTGMISPSKLRMKLMGHQRKKDGSNSNSARTSPSKLDDSEFVKNSLLASNGELFDEEVPRLETASVKPSGLPVPDAGQGDQSSAIPQREFMPRENGNAGRVRVQQFLKSENGNSSSVHPMRTLDDELDYDSTSSFEFQKGERSVHNPIGRSILRPMSSKWNDAEKWIMNRQNGQVNHLKNNNLQVQAIRVPVTNGIRVTTDSAGYDNKSSVKRVDFCQSSSQMGMEKFSFISSGAHPISGQGNGTNVAIDLCPQVKDLKEVECEDASCLTISAEESSAIRSVSMRDMGTEMTPVPSQEPSRTGTPVGATTPLRSPSSSIPSTPRRGGPTNTPADDSIDGESKSQTENGTKELSEEELKLKTRKEILALGVQLGKMNIAAWASKDEKDKNASAAESSELEELRRIEYEKRAEAWEEAEKSKHTARFKREEIKIQAWESQQKAKLDAEMRRIESQVEQMRAQAQAKMVKKIAMARQRSEEKRNAAEAKKNSEAEKLSAQAEYIRQTGRIPSSPYMCCGWS